MPTRGRAADMFAFLASVSAHSDNPHLIEVVAVVDADDAESHHFALPPLQLKTVIVSPGQTMGALNMAGFRASSGSYILLGNDDVRVGTTHWDSLALDAFRSFPDDVVLVHMNDLIFGKSLCTFPFVTRAFCELACGICDERYRRYMIDDAIHHIFSMVGVLGYSRIVYMPDLVLEHFNKTIGTDGKAAYTTIDAIYREDKQLFLSLMEERRGIAIKLVERIESARRAVDRDARWRALRLFIDADIWRDPAYSVERTDAQPNGLPRITLAFQTEDPTSDPAKASIQNLRRYGGGCELATIEPTTAAGMFARQVNRIMDWCRTDFLLIADESTIAADGFMSGMLRHMTGNVALVTPAIQEISGRLVSSATVVLADGDATPWPTEAADRCQPVPSICRLPFLLDLRKVGMLRLDEAFSQPRAFLDFGLKIWEAGFSCVLSGTTPWRTGERRVLAPDPQAAEAGSAIEHSLWRREWVERDRFSRLRKIWADVPSLDAGANGIF